MQEIYISIGKLVHRFQELEETLLLILVSDNTKECSENFIFEERTLGAKISKTKELHIFESANDPLVLDYIKNKRNWLIHSFFTSFNFSKEEDKLKAKEVLSALKDEAELIVKAVKRFACDYVHF